MTIEPEPPRGASLSERAYYLLRDRLVTLELPPGKAIDERALEDELGLSRTPIREALRKLADDGLIDVVPRRGIFASHIDLGDLSAISEVRVELEGSAARLAARRARGGDIDATQRLLVELRSTPVTATNRDSIRLDQRVHRLVYKATDNAFLAGTLEEYFVHSLRLWFFVLDRLPDLDQAVVEHANLLVAIRDGDEDTAERLLRQHVSAFENTIRSVL